jgi:hypothetical protein
MGSLINAKTACPDTRAEDIVPLGQKSIKEDFMYRGSRKHILDWTEQPDFIVRLLDMILPVQAHVTAGSIWMPRGYRFPDEARLETFGSEFLKDHHAWPVLRRWWLRHERGANTPNWDLAVGCEIEGKPGLIVVEAKANKAELKSEGKEPPSDSSSQRSVENHKHIAHAIGEARQGLHTLGFETRIDRDRYYQLSNRIAFAWKLASVGIPTVLVYLGFLGDSGIADVGPQFGDDADWRSTFLDHALQVGTDGLFQNRVEIGCAAAWFLVRSRSVIEVSSGTTQRPGGNPQLRGASDSV